MQRVRNYCISPKEKCRIPKQVSFIYYSNLTISTTPGLSLHVMYHTIREVRGSVWTLSTKILLKKYCFLEHYNQLYRPTIVVTCSSVRYSCFWNISFQHRYFMHRHRKCELNVSWKQTCMYRYAWAWRGTNYKSCLLLDKVDCYTNFRGFTYPYLNKCDWQAF